MLSDGNIAGISASRWSEYWTMPSSAAHCGRADVEAVEGRIDERAEDLAGAVGAEVGEEEAVAVRGAPA